MSSPVLNTHAAPLLIPQPGRQADVSGSAPSSAATDPVPPPELSKTQDLLQSEDDPYRAFQVFKVLGRGAYGTVYQAQNRQTGQNVALKECRTDDDPEGGISVSVLRELGLLKSFNHPNVMRITGVIARHRSHRVFIIMPLCRGDTLSKYLNSLRESVYRHNRRVTNDLRAVCTSLGSAIARNVQRPVSNGTRSAIRKPVSLFQAAGAETLLPYKANARIKDRFHLDRHAWCEMLRTHEQTALSHDQIRSYTRQLLDAVAYLHGMRVAHRDLKPGNIVFADPERRCLVITDFGCSRMVFGNQKDKEYTLGVVTQPYRPPELLLGMNMYDPLRVDLWSLGCVLQEIATLKWFPSDKDVSELEQLRLVYEALGTPTDETWPGIEDMMLLVNINETYPPRTMAEFMAETYAKAGTPPEIVHIIDSLLRLNPDTRVRAGFLASSLPPVEPEVLAHAAEVLRA